MKEKQKGPVLQQELKKGSLPEMIKEAKETEEDIRGLLFCGEILEGEDLSRLYFRGVRMENCRFFNCVMEQASFLDCVFSGCDFSNCRMEGSYFGPVPVAVRQGSGRGLFRQRVETGASFGKQFFHGQSGRRQAGKGEVSKDGFFRSRLFRSEMERNFF